MSAAAAVADGVKRERDNTKPVAARVKLEPVLAPADRIEPEAGPENALAVNGEPQADELLQDRSAVTSSSSWENKCNACGVSFRTMGYLIRHWQQRHIYPVVSPKTHELVRFVCDYCHTVFATRLTLEAHIVKHLRQTHVCSVCEGSFRTKQYLNHHLRLHMDDNKQHKCEYCGLVFISSPKLKRHMMSVHNGAKCKVCNKIFKSYSHLKVHLSVHSSERPFKCVTCNARLKNRSNLLKHMFRHTTKRSRKHI